MVFLYKNEFVREKSYINEIKRFLSTAKRRLAKFNGLTDEKCILYLKGCNFRFDLRNKISQNFL